MVTNPTDILRPRSCGVSVDDRAFSDPPALGSATRHHSTSLAAGCWLAPSPLPAADRVKGNTSLWRFTQVRHLLGQVTVASATTGSLPDLCHPRTKVPEAAAPAFPQINCPPGRPTRQRDHHTPGRETLELSFPSHFPGLQQQPSSPEPSIPFQSSAVTGVGLQPPGWAAPSSALPGSPPCRPPACTLPPQGAVTRATPAGAGEPDRWGVALLCESCHPWTLDTCQE